MTLDNVKAGYIPRSFIRDPAWYSDIRDLIGEYRANGRIEARVAGQPLDGLERSEERGVAGNELLAILFLEEVVIRAKLQIRNDAAARDAVLRPTQALIALLCPSKAMELRGH